MIFTNKKTGETLSLTLRPFQEQDCQQIIDCFSDAYGDSYGKPNLYTKEGILSYHNSGTLLFYVAETNQREIVSVIAQEKNPSFLDQVECSCQVTKEKYQGYAIGAAMLAYQCGMSKQENENCSFRAHPVAVHAISQKSVKSAGFQACGFLLNLFDNVKFRMAPDTKNAYKLSLTVAVNAGGHTKSGILWIPEELQFLAKKMYADLGVEVDFAPLSESMPLEGKGLRQVSVNHRYAATLLQVVQGGEDFPQWLSNQVKLAGEKGDLATVTLYLNTKKPSSPSAYEEARKQGFFFQGFLPCGEKEYILLHHPLKVRLSLDMNTVIEDYKPFVEIIRRQQHER